jgi:hypothetical protein
LAAPFATARRPLIEKVPLTEDAEEEMPPTPTSPLPKHFF